MPELPEVETCRLILADKIKGHIIIDVQIFYLKIIHGINSVVFIQKLINQKIHAVDRIGKHLLFKLDDWVLISHLRMEGKYFFYDQKTNIPAKTNEFYWKHVLVSFKFQNGSILHYIDTRRFGTMHLKKYNDYLTTPPLNKVGIEFIDSALTSNYLSKKWKNKSIAIKSAWLEQNIISGIGNIYANEILFACCIHPLTPTNKLTIIQIQDLITKGRKILKQAIKHGGTTVSTFKSPNGIDGKFSQFLQVHGRQYELCRICQKQIKKMKVNQRGTYFCDFCQII